MKKQRNQWNQENNEAINSPGDTNATGIEWR